MRNDFQASFQIILRGAVETGKTVFINYFAQNKLCIQYVQTYGVEQFAKALRVNNRNVSLIIWDSTGDEKGQDLSSTYANDSDIIFIFFDATNRQTYNHVKTLVRKNDDRDYILLGTHYDCQEVQVSAQEAELYASEETNPFKAFFPLTISQECSKALDAQMENIRNLLGELLVPKIQARLDAEKNQQRMDKLIGVASKFENAVNVIYKCRIVGSVYFYQGSADFTKDESEINAHRKIAARQVYRFFQDKIKSQSADEDSIKNLATSLVKEKNSVLKDHYDKRITFFNKSRLANAIDGALDSLVTENLLSQQELDNIKAQNSEPKATCTLL